MGKRNNKIKFGLALLLIVLIVVTIKPSIRTGVKKPFYTLLNPIQKRIKRANSFLLSLGQVVANLNHWQERVVQLEKDKFSLLSRNNELQQLEKENKSLREALDMDLQKDFKMKLVRVTAKNLKQNEIIINKGDNDGISKGMPVVNSQKMLVGRIIRASESASRIRIISHPEANFSAKLKDKKMEGEIKGQGNFGVKFDFIPVDKKIKQGQVVVTDALGGTYPAGLLVGKIKSVEQRDVKPFQIAELDIYYKANNDYLFVITNY